MNNQDRQAEIHEKGFDFSRSNTPLEYKKVRIGTRSINDLILDINEYAKLQTPINRIFSKDEVIHAIISKDYDKLRYISNSFFETNGIYARVCNYFAFLYRFDWYLAAEIADESVKEEKIMKDFRRILNYLDNSYIKKICGDISLSIVKNGSYYGYIVPSADSLILQELPVKYCRSRYSVNNSPVVEFNMKFFDTFRDLNYRNSILKLFPDEFEKGYRLYKAGKLPADGYSRNLIGSWYVLDPQSTVKFNFNNSDIPMFVNSIPAILDLISAQDLDRKRQMQKLIKILIQKLPMDKNGDLIFDIDEARDLHNNAVSMLGDSIGVDVLTSPADFDSIDLADTNSATTQDDLKKSERSVYNSLGISQNLFNTDGNLSLEKSILNDESTVRNMLLQFNIFFNRVVQALNPNSKKYNFKFYMLETTQYNYKDLAKLYKEQTQLGYSKMLPQIALGHSQSFILNTATFENNVLKLHEIMIPPLMSSTMSSQDVLGRLDQSKSNSKEKNSEQNTTTEKVKVADLETKETGRPEKPDDQKSEKTIQNRESMS